MTLVTLTVACPEEDRSDANHLAACLGLGYGWALAEWEQAFTAQRQDSEGNLYRVMSCPVGVAFVAAATVMGPVERPASDVDSVIDLTAARRAQDKLATWAGEGDVPQAASSRIVAVAGMTGAQAIAAMGLT